MWHVKWIAEHSLGVLPGLVHGSDTRRGAAAHNKHPGPAGFWSGAVGTPSESLAARSAGLTFLRTCWLSSGHC